MKNSWIKKGTFILCVLFIGFHLQAQRIGTWKAYMAYQNATLTAETPNKVFAVYDGSLLSYSPDDEEVIKYSIIDGLSDVGITHMAYSPEAKALILVYSNSNIDIFLGKDNVDNLPYIKDNVYIQDKTVNNVEISGSYAYLSTAFGIVVVDLQRKEIKDDYRLDANTQSVAQSGQYIYAATSRGVLRALTSTSLKDKSNWKDYPLEYEGMDHSKGDDKKITKILFFKGSLVFYQPGLGVYYQKNPENILLENGVFKQLSLDNNQLILVGMGYISFFTDFNFHTSIGVSVEYISNYNSKDIYWTAQGAKGLVGFSKQPTSPGYNIIVSGIQINSPKRNLNYYMTFTQNKLLVVGGGREGDRLKRPGTLMVYENGSWFNLDENEVTQQIQQEFNDKELECKDFTSVAVDPRDANHYFVSSWGEGLYEFKDNQFVQLHTIGNSTLESVADVAPSEKNKFVRVDGLAYDKKNNLYMTNSEVTNAFQTLSANGEWTSADYPQLAGKRVVSQQVLVSSRNGQKWINLPFGGNPGIFVLDDSNPAKPATAFSRTFADQQGTSTGAISYFCIVEDLNGTIWVGTDNGPILFNSANQVAGGTCSRIILTDEYGEGYYLLNGEKITSIAVDGGNRKWIGTAGSGVFLVNQSGTTTIVENFNIGNSELISNNINSIAINNLTGEVFIGTDKGLVSYMGDAIEGKSDYSNVYAFPNPVRPASNSQVVITGLMKDSNVKITDMAGNLIAQGSSAGGQFTWNCASRTGEIVKSGIYLVFAATPDGGEGVVTKIMVIK